MCQTRSEEDKSVTVSEAADSKYGVLRRKENPRKTTQEGKDSTYCGAGAL